MLVLRCGGQSVHAGRVSRHHAFRVTASQWRAMFYGEPLKVGLAAGGSIIQIA
jgi:hypothetical protein